MRSHQVTAHQASCGTLTVTEEDQQPPTGGNQPPGGGFDISRTQGLLLLGAIAAAGYALSR